MKDEKMPTLEEIENYLRPRDPENDDQWHDLLPSYQRICVLWLIDRLKKERKQNKKLPTPEENLPQKVDMIWDYVKMLEKEIQQLRSRIDDLQKMVDK